MPDVSLALRLFSTIFEAFGVLRRWTDFEVVDWRSYSTGHEECHAESRDGLARKLHFERLSELVRI
jgi:hypothetical protein